MNENDLFNPETLLQNLLLVAERRERTGDEGFLIRQHEYFHAAHRQCGCGTCGGCKATAYILGKLEQRVDELEQRHPTSAERERERAQSIWLGDKAKAGRFLAQVKIGHERLRQHRKDKGLE